MSAAKQVKEARKLVSQQRYAEAVDLVQAVTRDEPDNINALLIEAVCLQRLDRHEECVATLLKVVECEPDNIGAWRGLVRSYCSLNMLTDYFEAAIQLLYFLAVSAEGEEAAESMREVFLSMQKNVRKMARKHSTSKHTGKSFSSDSFPRELDLLLQLQIPSLPQANERMQKIHQVLTKLIPSLFEAEALSELIYHRKRAYDQSMANISAREKQTLGFKGPKSESAREEAFEKSELAGLLRLQIDTENDDETRHTAESSLLTILVDRLKQETDREGPRAGDLRAQVKDLTERMAMFSPVTPLAWELYIDMEIPSLDRSDYDHLLNQERPRNERRRKIKRHKEQLRKAENEEGGQRSTQNLGMKIADLSLHEDSQGTEQSSDVGEEIQSGSGETEAGTVDTPAMAVVRYATTFKKTSLGKILKAFLFGGKAHNEPTESHLDAGDSVFGWLLCARFCIASKTYASAIDAVHHGLKAAEQRRRYFGMCMDEAELQFKLILANSYTYFQAPKNFGLASDLYDEILESDPNNTAAMVGKGLILSEQGKLDSAAKLLEAVVENNPGETLALSELSWIYVQRGDIEKGISGLKRCISIGNTPLKNAELNFRIGWANFTHGNKNESFQSFVAALECSKSYAPAYTYLGLFFEEVAQDKQRAQKCYYRALELDSGEFVAGEKLASDFADRNQWDLVEVVASSVISSPKMKGSQIDWPYRALGIVCLNQLRYEDAVKYFQKCLRSQAQDVQAWIGLGEAYINSGRYSSAEKALKRALNLEPNNFSALYVLSLAQRQMLDFPASASALKMAIENSPSSSVALKWALADNFLRAAEFFMSQTKYGDALREIQYAFEALVEIVDAEPSGVPWGSAAEAVLQLINMGFASLGTGAAGGKLLEIPIRLTLSVLCQKLKLPEDISLSDCAEAFALRYAEASKSETKPRRVAAHRIAAETLRVNHKVEKAIEHLQAAITLEARNEDLWNSYGVLLQNKSAMVAQHCFVRALSLNGRNPDTWVNLAGLYLTIGDADLALESVDRALSLDAELPRAWIAQALAQASSQSKPDNQIYRTLEYAYLLSGNDQLANLAFATKEFELGGQPSPAGLGAITKLLAYSPSHEEGNLIMGLLLERLGDYENSLTHLERVKAWPHVARVQLALGLYSEAVESCENAGPDLPPLEALSCLLTCGLAKFFLNELDAAIESFTEALEVATRSVEENVLRMLVEVLYASQSADVRQVAQDQLFSSIEENGPTIHVTLLLGAIGVLEQDESVKEAAKLELQNLVSADLPHELLAQACRVLALLDPTDKSYQRAVFQWPTEYVLWRNVDKQQALHVAECSFRGNEELSQALVEVGGLRNAQRAVFLNPLSDPAWRALGEAVKISAV